MPVSGDEVNMLVSLPGTKRVGRASLLLLALGSCVSIVLAAYAFGIAIGLEQVDAPSAKIVFSGMARSEIFRLVALRTAFIAIGFVSFLALNSLREARPLEGFKSLLLIGIFWQSLILLSEKPAAVNASGENANILATVIWNLNFLFFPLALICLGLAFWSLFRTREHA